ncbi:MAG: hypothetical protein J5800_04840 [Spirochaetales bacterium]|nr:hypothetical protein [Spirochaetales bacterium]
MRKRKKRMKLKDRIRKWFSERYGDDELSKFLYVLSLILIALSIIPKLRFLLYVALLMILGLAIRSLSGNIEKRNAANERFLHIFRMSEKDKERRKIRREKKAKEKTQNQSV